MRLEVIYFSICVPYILAFDHFLYSSRKCLLVVWQSTAQAFVCIEQISVRIVVFCAFRFSFFYEFFYQFSYFVSDRDLKERYTCLCYLTAEKWDISSLGLVPLVVKACVIAEIQDICPAPSGLPQKHIQGLHLLRLYL